MSEISSISERLNRRSRVTIADVSEALGVTKSTVSRALNGYDDISESTRQRVAKMADKMGYRPLSHAQAIKTGITRSLGFVVQTADHDAQRPFLAEFLAGISCSASAAGWTLTVAAADGEEETLETMRNLVHDHKADGFILPRSMNNDPRVAMLKDMGTPFVLFGRATDPTGCAWFDFLGEDAMRAAVLRLASLGHERIAFVNGGMRYVYSKFRYDGYINGLHETGLKVDNELVLQDALTSEQGLEAAQHLMGLPSPPTAVVCAVDAAAIGFYRFAHLAGLTIGKDISLIAYDGTAEGRVQSPPLATFAVNVRHAGERLGDILIRRIRGDDLKNLRETDHASFLDRGSAGAPRLSSQDLARRLSTH